MERDFKGVWIPRDIWLNNELSLLDKCMLTEIDSLDATEKHCYASNEYFAEFFQCGVATVTRSISKLKELGYIDTEMVDGRHRVIKMMRQSNQNDETVSSKRLANNIYNNTNNNMDTNVSISKASDDSILVDQPKEENVAARTSVRPKREYTTKPNSLVDVPKAKKSVTALDRAVELVNKSAIISDNIVYHATVDYLTMRYHERGPKYSISKERVSQIILEVENQMLVKSSPAVAYCIRTSTEKKWGKIVWEEPKTMQEIAHPDYHPQVKSDPSQRSSKVF